MAKIIYRCKSCGNIIVSDTGEDIPAKKKEHRAECHPGFEEVRNEHKES